MKKVFKYLLILIMIFISPSIIKADENTTFDHIDINKNISINYKEYKYTNILDKSLAGIKLYKLDKNNKKSEIKINYKNIELVEDNYRIKGTFPKYYDDNKTEVKYLIEYIFDDNNKTITYKKEYSFTSKNNESKTDGILIKIQNNKSDDITIKENEVESVKQSTEDNNEITSNKDSEIEETSGSSATNDDLKETGSNNTSKETTNDDLKETGSAVVNKEVSKDNSSNNTTKKTNNDSKENNINITNTSNEKKNTNDNNNLKGTSNEDSTNTEDNNKKRSRNETDDYVVVFSYGTNKYLMANNDSVSISRLLSQLNLDINLNNIRSIQYPEEHFNMVENGNDYILTSTTFVDDIETLIISTRDNQTYRITVKDANRPDHTKTLTDNGNGTYELALSVTGAINTDYMNAGANILVIYDVSSSMTRVDYAIEDSYGMRGITTTGYGWQQRRVFIDLYGYVGGRCVNLVNNKIYDYSDTVYSNARCSTVYNDDRYMNRADKAEPVVKDFIEKLSQEVKGSKIYSMVTFSENANNIDVSGIPDTNLDNWTTDITDITKHLVTTVSTDQLSYTSGTHWENALNKASTEIGNILADDTYNKKRTYVVFITDGAPSQHNTVHSNGSVTVNTPDSDWKNHYLAATDDALALQEKLSQLNGDLFGIYAFGNEADYLDDLIYRAHNNNEERPEESVENGIGSDPTDFYYRATSATELQNAINEIKDVIVKAQGVTNIEIDDGTTTNVTLSSGAVASLLEVDESSYTYWMSKEVLPYTNSTEYEYYTTRIDRDSPTGAEFEVLITDGDPTDNRVKLTYKRPSDNIQVEKWVEGYVRDNILTIRWKTREEGGLSPDIFFGQEPPQAVLVTEENQDLYNQPIGTVVWDLTGENQPLLNGVTYTVKFNIWKKQEVFDLIADLENNLIEYEYLRTLKTADEDPDDEWTIDEYDYISSLTQEEFEEAYGDKYNIVPDKNVILELAGLDQYISRIGDPGNYTYILRTNTNAYLNYSDTRISNDELTDEYQNPDGIPVAKEPIKVSKEEWINGLDNRDKSDITLVLYRQKVYYGDINELSEEERKQYEPVEYLEIDLNESNNWQKDNIIISPGLITIDYSYEEINGRIKQTARDEDVKILDKGYDYFFGEKGREDYYWQLVAETVHPMLLNNSLVELIKMEKETGNIIMGDPVEYHIPVEMIENPNRLYMLSNNGHHFIRLYAGGDVYLIREVNGINIKASLPVYPDLSPYIDSDNVDSITVHLYADTDNENPIKTFTLSKDKLEEVFTDDTDPEKLYVFPKYLEEDGAYINYYVKVDSWLSNEELATIAENLARTTAAAQAEETGENADDIYNEIYPTIYNNVLIDYQRVIGVVESDIELEISNIDIKPEISAVNYRRSNLNLKKLVTGDDPNNTAFKFNLYVKSSDGKDLYFSVQNETGIKGTTISGEEVTIYTVFGLEEKINPNDTNSDLYTNAIPESYKTLRSDDSHITNIEEVIKGDVTYLTYKYDGNDKKVLLISKKTEEGVTTYTYVDTLVSNNPNITELKEVTIDGITYLTYKYNGVYNEVKVISKTTEDDVTTYGYVNGYYYFASAADDIYVYLRNGDNLRITNLPLNSEFRIEEVDTANFKLVNSEVWYNSTNTNKLTEDILDNITVSSNYKVINGSIYANNRSFWTEYTNDYLINNISGTKTWIDGNNASQTRPNNIIVKLYKVTTDINNNKVRTQVGEGIEVTATDNWQYTFSVDKYDQEGNIIVYEVDEEPITTAKYQKEINGYNITNTLLRDIPITKTWVDDNNKYNSRPDNIVIKLLKSKNVVVIDNISVVADNDGNWTYTFYNLPVYDTDNNLINYSIDEYTVTDYYKNITDFVITNTYIKRLTDVLIKKVWVENGTTTPNGVIVEIYDTERNTISAGSISLTASDKVNNVSWSKKLSLPMYYYDSNNNTLTEIDYGIRELSIIIGDKTNNLTDNSLRVYDSRITNRLLGIWTVSYSKDNVGTLIATNTWEAMPTTTLEFKKVVEVKVDGNGNIISYIEKSGAIFRLFVYIGSDANHDDPIDFNNPTSYAGKWIAIGDSDGSSLVVFNNLYEGEYRLVEIIAPEGYVLPKGQWKVIVSSNNSGGLQLAINAIDTTSTPAIIHNTITGDTSILIPNYEVPNIPSTGGIGIPNYKEYGLIIMLMSIITLIINQLLQRKKLENI